MPRTTTVESRRRARIVALNARLRACRRCHLAGHLDERESVPIARDPEPQCSPRRGSCSSARPRACATIQDRPFAGIAGDKVRAWFEKGGIPRDEFYARIHLAAITRCYPGRIPGDGGSTTDARGARPLPPLARRADRRPRARDRPARRLAGDPDVPRAIQVALGRRRHRRDRRRRPVLAPSASLRRQPMAQ